MRDPHRYVSNLEEPSANIPTLMISTRGYAVKGMQISSSSIVPETSGLLSICGGLTPCLP